MGSLDSFNPATGELIGSVETVEPSEVQGAVDDVAEVQPFWGELSLKDRGPLPAARRRGARRRRRRGRAAALHRAGQADHRGLHDGGRADDRRAPLDRRRGPGDPRRPADPDGPGPVPRQEGEVQLRAARRRRGDRALELPVVDPLRRGGDRADGRQRRRPQAREPDAAARRADPRGVREGGHPGRPDPGPPRRRRGRAGDLRVERPEDLLHRLGRGRLHGRQDLRRADEGSGARARRQGPGDRLPRRRARQRDQRDRLGRLRERRADVLGDRARLRGRGGGRRVRRGRPPRGRGARRSATRRAGTSRSGRWSPPTSTSWSAS